MSDKQEYVAKLEKAILRSIIQRDSGTKIKKKII